MLMFDPNALAEPDGWQDPPPPLDTTIRQIYFIHGLGGDKSSWEKTAQACQDSSLHILGFPARRCITSRPDYIYSRGSLYSAANEVRTYMNVIGTTDSTSGLARPCRSIIIAHSQGGLVARQLMHMNMVSETNVLPQHGMNYGGVVTVASPLQGAAILKNRTHIFTMAKDGCTRLAKGWGVQLNVIPLIGEKLKDMFNNLTESFCGFAIDNTMPMFFKEYYDGITKDYDTSTVYGKNYINMLNSDTAVKKYKDFPKMAFYAVEPQENLFWRTLNWMISNPNGNNGANGPDVEYFGANDDWRFYNKIRPIIDIYQAMSITYRADYDVLYKKCCVTNKKLNQAWDRYIAWRDGYDWFTGTTGTWQMIMGGKKCTSIPNPNYRSWMDPSYIIQCDEYENDGVVLAESAANLPGATWSPIRICPNENSTVDFEKGSSHMQVRNDAGLKKALNDLFNGDYEKWFKTPTK
jgi:pimeloyl-ACP methyl ester carboxylesterase